LEWRGAIRNETRRKMANRETSSLRFFLLASFSLA
jgi:hypothetical protein